MTELEEFQSLIGHNNPPSKIEEYADRITALVENANRWLTERPEILTEDHAEKADMFLGQLKAELKAVEAERKDEKQPYIEAGNAVQAKWKLQESYLDKCVSAIKPMLTAYMLRKKEAAEAAALEEMRKAEQARKVAEQAAIDAAAGDNVEALVFAEQAQEESAKADKVAEKAVTQSARPQVKGEFSARATSLRTTYTAHITDHRAALAHFADHPSIKDLVQKLANAEIRAKDNADLRTGARKIAGIEVVEKQEAA